VRVPQHRLWLPRMLSNNILSPYSPIPHDAQTCASPSFRAPLLTHAFPRRVHRDGLLSPRVEARRGSGAGGGGRGEHASQAEKGVLEGGGPLDARETDAAFHHRVGMSRADFTRSCPSPVPHPLLVFYVARWSLCACAVRMSVHAC
jgi:hypothetical protein